MFDYHFWFSQPSAFLDKLDLWFGWLFAVLTVLGVFLYLLTWANKHPIVHKLMVKFSVWFFSIGLLGLLWFLFRYENTPIFGKRFWAPLVLGLGLVWAVFPIKYVVTGFLIEKREHDGTVLKNKYLLPSKPKKK